MTASAQDTDVRKALFRNRDDHRYLFQLLEGPMPANGGQRRGIVKLYNCQTLRMTWTYIDDGRLDPVNDEAREVMAAWHAAMMLGGGQ